MESDFILDIDDEELAALNFDSPDVSLVDGVESLSCAIGDDDLMDGRRCVPFSSRPESQNFKDLIGGFNDFDGDHPSIQTAPGVSFVAAHANLSMRPSVTASNHRLPYLDDADAMMIFRPIHRITESHDPVHQQNYLRRLPFDMDGSTTEWDGGGFVTPAPTMRQIDLFERKSSLSLLSVTPVEHVWGTEQADRQCTTPAKFLPATVEQRCVTPSGPKTRLRSRTPVRSSPTYYRPSKRVKQPQSPTCHLQIERDDSKD